MARSLPLIDSELKTTLQFEIDSDRFVVRRAPQKQFEAVPELSARDGNLLTVFVVEDSDVVDCKYLEDQIQQYSDYDDVFRKEFLTTIVLLRSIGYDTPIEGLRPVLERYHCRSLIQAKYARPINEYPRGPYLFQDGVLYQTWKIYNDFNHAFVTAAWPSENVPKAFALPPTCNQASAGAGVPVPSRLYDRKNPKRPLAGDRIAVKDIFHLKGLKTSLCSRDYLDLYPEQAATAEIVRSLVTLGANIVGKTHLSSFAMWEEPTQCVDFQDAFNPRGDGYQSPAGSSSGSGAAIASYEWVDFTLGTYATGSGRRPALWNGSFALRPTAKILSTVGMVTTSKEFDVPSIFSRGISSLARLVTLLSDKSLCSARPTSETIRPWKIIYPTDYFPIANKGQNEAVKDFVEVLAAHVACKIETISLKERWASKPPSDKSNMDIFMEHVQVHGFWYEAYHRLDSFRKEHTERRGRPPYFTEVNRWIWGIAELLDQSCYNDAMARFHVFKNWFLSEILNVDNWRAIMILPIETLSPRYRDVPPDKKSKPPHSINELWLSPITGCPELVVPVGQVAFHSRISDQTEYLPVAVSLLSSPYSEFELMRLVEDCLTQAKRPVEVQVGKMMGKQFPKY